MAKKKKSSPPKPLQLPQVFEATLGANGAVNKGQKLTQAQAEAKRKNGQNVVVSGDDISANRRMAGEIERNANGSAKRCPPHATAGAYALPHFQPDPRPPDGHTFYETSNRKAF